MSLIDEVRAEGAAIRRWWVTHLPDDADGFQVLTMLKLDEETRGIPVVTYTTEDGEDESDDPDTEPSDEVELFPAAKAAVWMN